MCSFGATTRRPRRGCQRSAPLCESFLALLWICEGCSVRSPTPAGRRRKPQVFTSVSSVCDSQEKCITPDRPYRGRIKPPDENPFVVGSGIRPVRISQKVLLARFQSWTPGQRLPALFYRPGLPGAEFPDDELAGSTCVRFQKLTTLLHLKRAFCFRGMGLIVCLSIHSWVRRSPCVSR